MFSAFCNQEANDTQGEKKVDQVHAWTVHPNAPMGID